MIKATQDGIRTGRILEKTEEDKAAILELFGEQQATHFPEKDRDTGVWRPYDEKD